MSNREKYAGSAWAPGRSMDTAPGPLWIQERSLGQGGAEGEGGQGLHPTGRPQIPECLESQGFLHPKSCRIPSLAESQTYNIPNPATTPSLPYPKPHCIPNPAASQTCCVPNPATP